MNFRNLMVLFLILFNAASVFGQEKKIDENTFENAVMRTHSLSRIKSRSTTIDETFDGAFSKPLTISKTVTELIPPNRYRIITESAGNKEETIEIGDHRYIRSNGGQWEHEQVISGVVVACSMKTEYASFKLTENIKLNSKIADLYESEKKLTDIMCGNYSKREIWKGRFWISKAGLLLRSESEEISLVTNVIKRSVTTYEYNPKNLKIWAPIK